MDWNNNTLKRYMEAGLAVLIVLTLGLAGATGVLSPRAAEREQNEAAAENDSTKASQENENKTSASNPDTEETQEAIADGQYPIMGSSDVTVQEMVDYFNASGEAYPAEELSEGGADSIETFCQMYYDEATAEGVRPEVAFAQTMKETGFLQYGGDASIEQFNFAGLGTTGNGVPGNSYPDVQTGIRAQIQHLKAYATSDSLNQDCVDDRYEYVKKGSAPYVQWLGQQENPEGLGWATGDNYGYDIVGMIEDMME
ncbi:MAG TPA: glucosaminidase domain-containing protein [Candidatus Mediterraneibacter intestinigallinarum]|nr:glucosaminidase domain-containing protein [Candidatus Mediterraneibacter intestinigallinarum]